MIKNVTYRTAMGFAIGLHVFIMIMLTMEHHSDHFVVQSAPRSDFSEAKVDLDRVETQPIRAVSVDSQAVTDTLNRLKNERAQKQQAELNRQRAAQKQLQMAQQQRVREQQRLEHMKKEAAQLALAQQKKLAVEKQHLQDLAKQKMQQERNLADLKQQQLQLQKQQIQEKQHLADLQKQKQADAERAQRELAAQEKARQAQQAAVEQQHAAQMSGEVNKYKALIIQAISQHWILPEHINNQLFSQFRIRLAPNGTVLSVNLIRSSGDPVLDRSAQAAIYKASPLPVPSDQAMFNLFRDISLTVRPESARG